MSDRVADLDLDDGGDHVPAVAATWQPRRWWAWSIGALLLGACALLGAGLRFAETSFGTTLRERACDTSPLGGFALVAAGAMLTAFGMQLARLSADGAALVVDANVLALTLPIPTALLAATLPGVLGCSLARDIASLGLIGDALVGTSGLLLAAASSALVGVALASSAHVAWLAPQSAIEGTRPSLVELAMHDAEALQSDPAALRFHGVDSGDAGT